MVVAVSVNGKVRQSFVKHNSWFDLEYFRRSGNMGLDIQILRTTCSQVSTENYTLVVCG